MLSGWVFGFDLWYDYLTRMSRFQAGLLENRGSFFLGMMPSTFVSVRYTLRTQDLAAWIPHVLVASAALLLYAQAVRRGARLHDLAFIAATATFLVLPYAFNYDMTVVSLGFALILFRRWDETGVLERIALIGGYISPQLTFLGKIIALPFAPLVLIVGLYVQVRLCRPREGGDAGLAPPSQASPGA